MSSSGLAALKGQFPLIVAGGAAFSMSTMFSSMKPVLLTRFVEQTHYPEALAGLLVAMPFVGTALSSLAAPFLSRRLSMASAVTLLGGGLIASEALNAFAFAIPSLVLLGQFVAGLCAGALMGLTSQLIAVSRSPDQIFGLVDMVGVLLMSFMIAAIGGAVEWQGLRGGFLAAVALCLLFTAPMYLARGLATRPAMRVADAARGPVVSWRPVAIVAMGMVFVTFSGLGFAFMFTAARELGFGYQDAGSSIGTVLFFSSFACLAGGWCSARFGHERPLLCAFALCAIGWWIAYHTQDRIVFLAALVPAIFALQFCFPVLLALAGAQDGQGHWAAIGAPLITSGFAWAAIAAGTIVEAWGMPALPFATIGGMLVCAILLVVTRREPVALAAR